MKEDLRHLCDKTRWCTLVISLRFWTKNEETCLITWTLTLFNNCICYRLWTMEDSHIYTKKLIKTKFKKIPLNCTVLFTTTTTKELSLIFIAVTKADFVLYRNDIFSKQKMSHSAPKTNKHISVIGLLLGLDVKVVTCLTSISEMNQKNENFEHKTPLNYLLDGPQLLFKYHPPIKLSIFLFKWSSQPFLLIFSSDLNTETCHFRKNKRTQNEWWKHLIRQSSTSCVTFQMNWRGKSQMVIGSFLALFVSKDNENLHRQSDSQLIKWLCLSQNK